jgi:hypothetical protein
LGRLAAPTAALGADAALENEIFEKKFRCERSNRLIDIEISLS